MLPRRLQTILAHPHASKLVILLAVASCLPALLTGLAADDLMHRAALTGAAGLDSNPFDFAEQIPTSDGEWPVWWAEPELRVAFVRPLASLSHRLDYASWPDAPALMHLHSVLLYGLLVWVIWRIYARLPGPAWGVGLAAVLFALDDAHGSTVAWIAARNALLAALFGFGAFAAYLRHLRDAASPWWELVGPLLFATALMSSEAASGALGYPIAHALVLDTRPRRARLRGLAPYLAVGIAWGLVRLALGAEIHGTGMYTDPFAEPLRFGALLIPRLALLVAGQLGLPLVLDISSFVPGASVSLAVAALVTLVGVGWLLRRWLRSDPIARFWLLGMLLAAVPLTAVVGQERHLIIVGLGGSGLVARLIVGLSRARVDGRGPRVIGWIFVVLHLLLAPLLLPARALTPSSMRAFTEPAARLALDRGGPAIVVTAPSDLSIAYANPLRRASGDPSPVFALHTGPGPVQATRLDERTLEMRAERGWLASPMTRIYRRAPLPVGTEVRTSVFTARVVATTDDGRPSTVRFTFAADPDTQPTTWIAWSEQDLPRVVSLPVVGRSVQW